MPVNFEKFAQEANEFLNELARELGHAGDKEQTLIILRAVLHSLRDRISIAQSLNLTSSLPTIIRGIYFEHWKYKEPDKYKSLEEFKNAVKTEQRKHGETRFDWPQSTEEIAAGVFNSLRKYLSEGQIEHIKGELPLEIRELFEHQEHA